MICGHFGNGGRLNQLCSVLARLRLHGLLIGELESPTCELMHGMTCVGGFLD